MKGAVFYATKYGSTAQYAEWIGEATGLPVLNVRKENADPVASEEELHGFDYMDKDSIGPVVSLAKKLASRTSEPSPTRLSSD